MTSPTAPTSGCHNRPPSYPTMATMPISPPSQAGGASHLYDLPNEILTEVARCLTPSEMSAKDNTKESRRDLRNLSLVSKRLRDITTRILYSHVHVSSVRQLNLLNWTLFARPGLFSSIHKLSLSTTLCYCAGLPIDWNNIYNQETICNELAWLVLHSKSLRELLLNLNACEACWLDHVNWDHFKDCGGLNVGYNPFSRSITQDLSLGGGPHSQLPPKLETVYIANSRAMSSLVCFPTLFSIPSLRKVVFLQDPYLGTGWERRESHNFGHFEDDYTHIKTVELRNTGHTSSGISKFCEVFPALQNLSITNNHYWTLNLRTLHGHYWSSELKDISSCLAEMTELTQLSLDTHIFSPFIVFYPQALGPSGGITGLADLENLTKLTIGMHLLMQFRTTEASWTPKTEPLSPAVLPQSLRELQLYTCFHCLERTGPVRPKEFSVAFVEKLALQLDRFPHLEQVLYFSEASWWYGDVTEPSITQRRDKKTGEIWFAGFEWCADTFATRNVHFRQYDSSAFACAGQSRVRVSS